MVAFIFPGDTLVVESFIIVGVNADRLVVIRNRFVVVPFIFPCMAAIVVCFHVIRIQMDRLIEIRNRPVAIAFVFPGDTTLVVRDYQIGSRQFARFDGACTKLDRFVLSKRLEALLSVVISRALAVS